MNIKIDGGVGLKGCVSEIPLILSYKGEGGRRDRVTSECNWKMTYF